MHVKNGGLQLHSIGEAYPFAVIGTIDEKGNTRYYVKNLIDGHERRRRDGQNYHSTVTAHLVAETLAINWRNKHATAA